MSEETNTLPPPDRRNFGAALCVCVERVALELQRQVRRRRGRKSLAQGCGTTKKNKDNKAIRNEKQQKRNEKQAL